MFRLRGCDKRAPTAPGQAAQVAQHVSEPSIIKEVGGAIRAARKARGMTQLQLAVEAGVNAQTIHRAESGSIALTIGKFAVIAKALGVSPAQLLTAGGEAAEASVEEAVLLGVWRKLDDRARPSLLRLMDLLGESSSDR